MKKVVFLVLSVLVAFQTHAGLVTNQVLNRVMEANANGETPVVILDLDDTLFDSRTRKAIIFREYAFYLLNEDRDESIAFKIFSLPLNQYHYGVSETLHSAGIRTSDIHEEINNFWKERFFTNEYAALDLEIPGAADFVQTLKSYGAKIVYLTGRDTPGMRKGTLKSLERRGFPSDILITKPTFEMDDTQFKKEAFEEIKKMGEIVAVFENEPRNLNAMIEAFPRAQAVFLDTLHSDKPDLPSESADHISDYL